MHKFALILFLIANLANAYDVSFLHEHENGADEVVLVSEEDWQQRLPEDFKTLWTLPKTNTYPKLTPSSRAAPEGKTRDARASYFIPWSDTFISASDLRDNIGLQFVSQRPDGKYTVSIRLIPSTSTGHPALSAILQRFADSSDNPEVLLLSETLNQHLLALYTQTLAHGLKVRSVDCNQAFTDRGAHDAKKRTVIVSYPSIGFSHDEILFLRKETAFLASIASPSSLISATVQQIYMTKLLTSGAPLRVGVGDHLRADLLAGLALREKLYAPLPEPDGRVQTLNNMGGMSPVIDEASRAFIEHCVRYTGPFRQALEIGTSYGLVAEEIRRRGGMHLVANDIDYRHLAVLARKLQGLGPHLLKLLTLVPGRFPDGLNLVLGKSRLQFFDAILAARVFHFMNPEQFEEAITAVYSILDTGGVFYAVMLTPYVRAYYDRFMPVFKERLRRGDRYPGYVENLADYADPALIPPSEQKRTGLAQPFHFFDEESVRRVLERVGFVEITITYAGLPYKSKLWSMPDLQKENLLVKAYKPSA